MQKSQILSWVAQHPLLQRMVALEPITWFNPRATTLAAGLPHVGLTAADVADAEQRLARFAPYLAAAFPETQPTKGIIESELVAIPAMQLALDRRYGQTLGGRLLLKKDSHLPISGSIKARGGIYEVLTHAEKAGAGGGAAAHRRRLRPAVFRRVPSILQPVPHRRRIDRQSGIIHRHHQRPVGV